MQFLENILFFFLLFFPFFWPPPRFQDPMHASIKLDVHIEFWVLCSDERLDRREPTSPTLVAHARRPHAPPPPPPSCLCQHPAPRPYPQPSPEQHAIVGTAREHAANSGRISSERGNFGCGQERPRANRSAGDPQPNTRHRRPEASAVSWDPLHKTLRGALPRGRGDGPFQGPSHRGGGRL